MRWVKLTDGNLRLDLCITRAELKDFYNREALVFLRITQNGKQLYSLSNEAILDQEECIQIGRELRNLLNGLTVSRTISFKVPGLKLEFDTLASEYPLCITVQEVMRIYEEPYSVQYRETGKEHTVRLNREQTEYLCKYFEMLQAHSDSRKAYPELFESGVFYYGWQYCLVGNVIGLHETEKGEVSGTARFAKGTKVYIAPPSDYRYQNGKKKEQKCSVIGKLRKHSKLVYDTVPLSYIENLRVQKVFNPMVLDMMDWSYDVWWGNRETDKEETQKYITKIVIPESMIYGKSV